MADRMAGRVLNGRYELLGVLGGGGMALVYRARDRALNRTVAVKVLREQYASDPVFLQRFTREAQAAGALSHPNVVSVYDVGQEDGIPYIVMEYVPGLTLRDLIARDGVLPVDQAVEIAAQILAALDYAHRNGLIHRDIKPGNVLITPQGTVKVVDFGIAKSASDLSLTGAGLALGTAAYFSPEQARGEAARPQSDIYSVGVTLYEMLTGHTPFTADSDVGMAFRHINDAPIPPRQWNPAVPPLLEQIVLRALAKNPAARFSSAAEMEQALRSYAAFGAQATAAVPAVVAPAPAPRVAAAVARPLPPAPVRVQSYRGNSGSWLVWLLGLVALLLLLGSAVLVYNSGALFSPATATPSLGGAPTFTAPTPVIVHPTATPFPATDTPVPTATPAPTAAPSATAVPLVTTPDLTSHALTEAQAIAGSVGLKVNVTAQQSDPNHPDGTILTQDPQSGAQIPAGSTINVVVSTGPPVVSMPNIINTDGKQAQQYLGGLGFQVTVQQEPSDSVPTGVVTRQAPDPGTSVRVGDTVTIWVSSGPAAAPTAPPTEPPPAATPTVPPPAPTDTPPVVAVPDVVGMDQHQAVTLVSQAHLTPRVQYVGHSELPPGSPYKAGEVSELQPPAGSPVARDTVVVLSVVNGGH